MNFESEIERIFWERYSIYRNESFRATTQAECQSSRGTYRLDFLLVRENPPLRIGLECDGKEFHRQNEQQLVRDARRDKILVEEGFASRIYRFRGQDIYHRIEDALHLLGSVDPDLFTARGLQQLEQLASPSYRREDESGRTDWYFPFVARRRYVYDEEWFDKYGSSLEDEDPNFEERMPPTSIYWTQ